MAVAQPLEVYLDNSQKQLLKQFADENWTGLVATFGAETVRKDNYSENLDDLQIANVLYETHGGGADVPRDAGLAKVGFSGIIASAAVW